MTALWKSKTLLISVEIKLLEYPVYKSPVLNAYFVGIPLGEDFGFPHGMPGSCKYGHNKMV